MSGLKAFQLLCAIFLSLPLILHAEEMTYFDCVNPDGTMSYRVVPCNKEQQEIRRQKKLGEGDIRPQEKNMMSVPRGMQPTRPAPALSAADKARQEFAAAEGYFNIEEYGEAAKLYRQAAEQGYAPAQFGMGVLYDIGRGVAQDYKLALSWYTKAAEQGYAKAQNNLGFMYSQGKGTQKDYVAAHKWFNVSGARGYEEGRKNREVLEGMMTPEQLALAQQQAGEWMKAHP